MIDKNGKEIKTGAVVEIKGAFFKNDNGFYFVEHSAGDPDWCGTDHSLRKISKKGKISKAKYNLCFWPIMITTNSWIKSAEAREWNREHATIEVLSGIDRSEVKAHFLEQAEGMNGRIEYAEYNFGIESPLYKKEIEIKEHFLKVANEISA